MRYVLIVALLFIGRVFASNNVLFLSDIHFSPYLQCNVAPCITLGQLIESDIQYWPQILKNDNSIQYKIETSNKLLINGLFQSASFAKQSNVQNIFVTGDILAHHFNTLFLKYAPIKYQNQEELTKFSLKTSEYVLAQIESANKNSKIFYVLGNNDGDKADYIVPSTAFLESMAFVMNKYLPTSNTVEQNFINGGYYTAMLDKKTMIIGLNSNLLSAINPNKDKALAQLKWLNNVLKNAQKNHLRVILLQHIPYGIDAYKTATSSSPAPIIVPILTVSLQKMYLRILNKYANIVSGIYAGHYHADYWSLLQPSNIVVIGTLALNSNFGNNPGFNILNLDNKANLINYNAYSCSLSDDNIYCHEEYQLSNEYGVDMKNVIHTMSGNTEESKTISYRKFYNGNNQSLLQPISDDKYWKYYFCAINNITIVGYSNCITDFK